MNKNQLLKNVFSETLGIEDNLINDELKYQSIPEWDSVNHMYLVTELENSFELEIDSDDILEIKSFKEAKEVLKKYGVEF